MRWTARGTNTGDYFGMPATGKPIEITGMNSWRTRDGKAIEGWVNRDDIRLLQQLGVIPSPGLIREQRATEQRTLGQQKTTSGSSSSSMYEEVWNKGNYDYARRRPSHADFNDHPPTRFFDVGRTGPEALTEAAKEFRNGIPDFHDTPSSSSSRATASRTSGRSPASRTARCSASRRPAAGCASGA